VIDHDTGTVTLQLGGALTPEMTLLRDSVRG
jgi:hypothetical protein